MYPDVESIVRLNAMHRAEIRQDVLGAYHARQAWLEPANGHERRMCPLRRPLGGLRRALARVRVLTPVDHPIADPLP